MLEKLSSAVHGFKFAKNKNHYYFYWIIDTEIYICAECGLWQKSYSELKEKIGYEEDMSELLLPFNWNENGVKAYLKKRIEKQKKHDTRLEQWSLVREEAEMLEASCCSCVYMKRNECEYNFEQNLEENEDYCEDYEER